METGLYGPLWQMPFDTYSRWTSKSTWIHHTCQFLSETEIMINVPHFNLGPQRKNDKAIMELATRYSKSTTILRAINRVRMLHEVVHLSDITTANGKTLDTAFLRSDPFPEKRNNFTWPSKHHVSSTDFTAWRHFMESVFNNVNFSLHCPLGQWTISQAPQSHDTWHWYVSKDRRHLYERVQDKFAVHDNRPRERRYFQYNHSFTNHLPPDVLPASVDLQKDHIHLVNIGPTTLRPPAPPTTPITFTREPICQLLQDKLPPWSSQRIRTSPTLQLLYAELLSAKLELCQTVHTLNETEMPVQDGLYLHTIAQNLFVEAELSLVLQIVVTATEVKLLDSSEVQPPFPYYYHSFRNMLQHIGLDAIIKLLLDIFNTRNHFTNLNGTIVT